MSTVEKEKRREEINKSGMYYIIKDVDTLESLEKEWSKYNSFNKELRHRSDEMSFEIYGKDNEERYAEMKSKLLNKDDFSIEDIPLESSRIVRQERRIPSVTIRYSDDQIEEAIEWSNRSSRSIVYPTDNLETLERLWRQFNNQHRQLQRESDWKSLELFGLNNQDHYEYLKSKFLIGDIDDDPEEIVEPPDDQFPRTNLFEMTSFEYGCLAINELSGIEKDAKKLELSLYEAKALSENIKKERVLSDSIESEDLAIDFVDNRVPSVLPSLTSDEMLDLGVYGADDYYAEYKALRLNENFTSKDWFEDYRNVCSGIISENTEELTLLRYNKLGELVAELQRDPNNLQLKQWILELGWNPEIPYTQENKLLAYKNTKEKLKNFYNEFEFVDISNIDNISYIDEAVDEESKLYPLYLVILSSTTPFGKAIKKFTHSIYSHSGLSFDSKMNKIYSYNLDNGHHGGGLSFENINGYGEESNILVNVIFLTKKDITKIKTKLDYYISNFNKTNYSIKNIFNIVTNKVEDSDLSLVCSQFVDKMLKSIGIDITHKPSNLVTPKDLSEVKSKKIYTVYKGPTRKYNQKSVDKKLNKLRNTAKVFKEYFSGRGLDSLIETYELVPIGEAKEFPVQFDKEGNLLIKNMKKMNYDEEYMKSHKLLKLYEKSKNVEGIKYELAKLWFMYNLLEKIRFNKKLSEDELKSVNDSRARIQNDFQKYLTFVQKYEQDFNFNEYYESTPFSDAAYKVNASTLKYSIKLLKSMIKP